MKKRNMSLILVLALILCLIPATAFADTTWTGNISNTTYVEDTVTVDGTVTINAAVAVTNNGKIVVPNGATLIIGGGYLYLSTDDVDLEIQKGGKLVVNYPLYTKKDLSDNTTLSGEMVVSGSNSGVITNHTNGVGSILKVGGSANYLLQLDSTAKATITSLGETSADGYKYVISEGKAETYQFPINGKDELVVADGAVLDASQGITLSSATGASSKQITVKDGGKLIANADILAATIGKAGQQKVTSGTYTANPSAYKADGYKVVQNEAKTEWTVKPDGILSKIAVTVKEPVVGETPATTYTSTVETKYSATATDVVVWFKVAKNDYVAFDDNDAKDVWTLVEDGEKFQKDYYYAFITYFEVADGYEISNNLAVTVNGKKADYVEEGDYAVGFVKEFGPLAEKSPVTGDNNELGLFAVAGLISALGVALMLRRKHSM